MHEVESVTITIAPKKEHSRLNICPVQLGDLRHQPTYRAHQRFRQRVRRRVAPAGVGRVDELRHRHEVHQRRVRVVCVPLVLLVHNRVRNAARACKNRDTPTAARY